MLIPISTDAPIYHFPWATIVVIVTNLALYIAGITPDNEAAGPYLLEFTKGLHPLQWLTASFLHDSLLTLIVNMIFVWTFGLVVEGKVGAWWFLLLYLGIAAICCGLEQSLMEAFGHRQFLAGEASFGAGTATFGLLGVALVWAPKNEMNCALIVGRPVLIDIAILSLATIFVLLEFVIAVFSGFWILGSIVHVAGAVLGMVAGLILLKLDWVDCENWDLLAVIAGREGKPPPTPEESETDAQRTARLQTQGTEAGEHIRHLLGMEKIEGALALHMKMARTLADWKLPETDLSALIKGLHRQSLWNESLPLMADYLRDYPERSTRMRLKLAELLVKHAERPRLALKVLSRIPPGSLPADLEAFRKQLEEQARRLEPDALTEPDVGEDW